MNFFKTETEEQKRKQLQKKILEWWNNTDKSHANTIEEINKGNITINGYKLSLSDTHNLKIIGTKNRTKIIIFSLGDVVNNEETMNSFEKELNKISKELDESTDNTIQPIDLPKNTNIFSKMFRKPIQNSTYMDQKNTLIQSQPTDDKPNMINRFSNRFSNLFKKGGKRENKSKKVKKTKKAKKSRKNCRKTCRR
jgi:hypothetical protein